MSLLSSFVERDGGLQVLWEEGECVFCRAWHEEDGGERRTVLAVVPASEHPSPRCLDHLAHEYGLKDVLDEAWAARPLALECKGGTSMLMLEDPGGEPLARRLGTPMAIGSFLPLAMGIAQALGKLHARGLVHKDLKPSHLLVDCADGQIRLTGFGLASRLPRERQAPAPPEFIAGTLAYMAPEQTGRMNHSIDSRSDLYALGVVLYQMLTGMLPFMAADPMGWVHCHVARKPVPPAERLEQIPAQLSQIVMKLLAKTAEERYQTAAAVERDLRRCLADWEASGRIANFPLGEQDIPDRLLIPELLYGRAHEVECLIAAFDRLVDSGTPELVLVSGYSGIGKSAVVHELHKALVPTRGLFAYGKFDQYKRDIPYATLAQAFQGLIRPLLALSDAALAGWRDALLEALGPNAKLMVDLVPELKLITGEPPPVPELPPQQTQSRFQLVFRRFLGVFARPEHPLVLFLDDLQWLDPATLDLVEDVLVQLEVRHLLLIGAYRNNEVTAGHPLMRKLTMFRQAGARLQEIRLAPLTRANVRQLIADALRCRPAEAAPLARLVHDKTGGNPFFTIQFLHALDDEGLLRFDHEAARWCWDLGRIHAKGYTDNVVELMVGKLTRLPKATQTALQNLACLGNDAEFATLCLIHGGPEPALHADLWEAVRQELILRLENTYKFVHDRVQEAAYSLIPANSRAAAHLRIGRLLAVHTPAEKRDEAIFEIVNQLNRGHALITAQEERDQLAMLNLMAGQRAKRSTAYASALAYLIAGASLLTDDCWERRHELIFALELERAECEFLTGALTEAEQRLAAQASRAATTLERATVACLRVDLYTTLDQGSRAIAIGLDYLRHLNIDWSPHPTKAEAQGEYARIWSQLGGRTIEALIELPFMSDPASLATMNVLTKIIVPALYTDANLHLLVTCRAVNLSLEHGNCDASCAAYAFLGILAGPRFGDYQEAYRFGRLGYDLVEERGLTRFQARVYMEFGNVVLPWMRHVRLGRDFLRRAFEAANKIGDLIYAAYCGNEWTTNMLAAGDNLAEVQREAEHGLTFAQKARFGFVVDCIATQLGLIRTLRGLTPVFGCFDDAEFNECRIERRFSENPDLAFVECWYWVRKLQARFLAGDYEAAIAAAARAEQLLWTSPSYFESAEYQFYSALSYAAACDEARPAERRQHLETLAALHRELQIWATNCPENFENRAALVGAEIARIEGHVLDAEQLYEQAIRSARANGFIHNEALAHELAARFYAARGFDTFAQAYLRNARYGYLRWGAEGKVQQLDRLYPQLRQDERAPGPADTIGAPVEHLDLATVMKVSQAVSGEIVLEKLLDTVIRTAIEQAGAERGLLIMAHGPEHRIEAEATTRGDIVAVHLHDAPIAGTTLPLSVLHYVSRTREGVILDDAAAESEFSTDPYIGLHSARSVLCLPLLNRAKLLGMLYLENNLTPRVFAPARITALKLLASQAAIALENTRLYRDLEQREAKIRRLVEANIIGIFIFSLDGRIIEANDFFLQMVGYDRADLAAGRIRWTDLTPPEWRARDALAVAEVKLTGAAQPYEKGYIRKDGSRLPVLIGVAMFEEGGDEGVAFVLDLSERKRAEAEAREMQTEMAHANRMATMGQLTASIAHEINQPIGATVTNAQAALRWLRSEPPDLQAAARALDRIVQDGNRAGNIIHRLRALIKKAPPRMEGLAINDAIVEIMALTRSEAAKQGVTLRTQLAEGLPSIQGDRVQLQQVVLNLILNAIEAMSQTSDGARDLLVSSALDGTDCVQIGVRDSGPGFAPGTLEHVFVPFYTTKATGLGMGLAICRSIISVHGGRLWAEANEPQGAVFWFTVPTRNDAQSL